MWFPAHSGGVQEETSYLGVPCLTARSNTERPVTVTCGTNRLVGTSPDAMLRAAREALEGPRPETSLPELWDGKAAQRIVKIVKSTLSEDPRFSPLPDH